MFAFAVAVNCCFPIFLIGCALRCCVSFWGAPCFDITTVFFFFLAVVPYFSWRLSLCIVFTCELSSVACECASSFADIDCDFSVCTRSPS